MIGTISSRPDYYVNINSLEPWYETLIDLINSNSSHKVEICAIGDSITEGMFAGRNDSLNFSSYVLNGWLGRTRTALHKLLEDTGRGFIPQWFTEFWTYTGTWVDVNDYPAQQGMGLAGRIRKGVTGAGATFLFEGTGLEIFGVKKSTLGKFTVSVDGAASVEFDEYSVTNENYAKFSITGLSNTTHSAVITVTGDEVWLVGARETKGSKGVVVNNTARGMHDSKSFMFPETLDFIFTNFQPKLTIISLLSNDFAHTTYTSYYANIATLIEEAQKTGSVLLTSVGVNSPYVFNRPYSQPQYISLLNELVIEYDVAFVDIYKKWGDSFDNALLRGVLRDGVTHPNFYGHLNISEPIIRAIIPQSIRHEIGLIYD